MRRRYEIEGLDQRARVAYIILSVAFLFLVLVFMRFQLMRSGELRLKSDENRLRVFPLMPPRGILLDRSGRILADNRPFYSVSLRPGKREILKRQLSIIARVFPESHLEIERILSEGRLSSLHPVRVLERVSNEAIAVLEEHRNMLPGLKIQSEPLRHYPHGEALAHVLGYVGRVSQKEINSDDGQEFKVGDYIGRSGIEAEYDELLRGRWGASYVEFDAMGREVGPFKGKEIEKPKAGESLTLTIDLDLQLAAAELFPEEKKGAVICLDPRNGEVLALYSQPSFDPNVLSRGLSPREWSAISGNPESPLLNRAIQATYPPGSTFKPITAIIAIDKGLFESNILECVCYGGMQFGRRWFGCWKEGGHGHIGFKQGLAQSCDVYFYKLGIRVGLETLTGGAIGLGLGEPTGVDLPGEVAGLIPTLEWYDTVYGPGNWGRGVIMNLSIGQGEILVTPIQLARVFSMIANGGRLIVPHLVSTEMDDEATMMEFSDESSIDLLRESLVEAVNGEKATGKLAASGIGSFVVAGKTGTAQNPVGEDHALFVGYAPADDPEILCVAVIEESGHGGSVAAPIVGGLIRHYSSLHGLIASEHGNDADTNKGSRWEG